MLAVLSVAYCEWSAGEASWRDSRVWGGRGHGSKGPVDKTWAVAASDKSPERLAALKLSSWRGPGTLVVVTHGVTVQSLVGIMPGEAETVVLRPKLGKEPGSTLWAGFL